MEKMRTFMLMFILAASTMLGTPTMGQGFLQNFAKSLVQKAVDKRNQRVLNRSNLPTNQNLRKKETISEDEVKLLVSGKASDSEKATTVALRSAIEQAYGTFVSANTTILNDDLVKDEIVTISNGNIKSYKVLSDVKCEDGQVMVTVDATVCISKLISYAKSKGASTEFAGATFAQNLKMKKLYKQNETKALDNLLTQVKELLPICYDLEICSVGEPKESVNFPNNYELEMVISFIPNENARTLGKTFLETLKGLSEEKLSKDTHTLSFMYAAELSKETRKFISNTAINNVYYSLAQECLKGYNPYDFYLRNSTDNFGEQLKRITTDVEFGFVITDNLGGKSYFTPKFMGKSAYELIENGLIKKGGYFNIPRMEGNAFVSSSSFYGYGYYVNFEKGFSIKVLLAIPQNDISKYSKFEVSLRK